MNKKVLCIILFFVSLSPALLYAETISGLVVRVIDGDTLVVLCEAKRQEKVRLAEIDCPEKKQAFGQKAKAFTADLVAGNMVSVEIKTIDRYGRIVGEVFLTSSGASLNRELVANGYAWWYRRYSKDSSLGQIESTARRARLGLWHDNNPTPPWEWRRLNR